jgi:hypothetical protein
MTTERPSPRYAEIDSWDASDALEAMIDGQFSAVAAVRTARSAIEAAARAMEARLRYRGRLIYVGAGTSGRLAVQDGAELMPTFSWPSERLLLIMAGGAPAFTRSIEGAEDRVEEAIALIREHKVDGKDVLVAVAASGTTPFTVACLREALRRAHDRHRQQSRDASFEGIRSSCLARYRLGTDRRFDAADRRHRSEDHAQSSLLAADDPARTRLRRAHGGHAGDQ